ncbi:cell division protein FtsQ/DivIB [Alsobacter soli]|nr:cell division protein FtsQ/DivIB [Alsobacter soli]
MGPPVLRASERVSSRLPRHIGSYLLFGFLGAVGLFGAVKGGQYDDFVALYGAPQDVAARALGFSIQNVAISGLVELNQTEVLQVAGIDPRGSLPFFDAAAARERLMNVPLIKDATVRKLYPNGLAITLVEREAFALWQKEGRVYVVAQDGTVTDTLNDPRFNHLPLVVGEGANAKASVLTKLLDGAPDVKAHVRAGMFVGQRRWTLKMDNGVDVRLPEENPARALTRLAGLIKDQKILDKDVLAIDLRMPDRVVLRLGEEAATARAEELKAKFKPKGNPT